MRLGRRAELARQEGGVCRHSTNEADVEVVAWLPARSQAAVWWARSRRWAAAPSETCSSATRPSSGERGRGRPW